MARARKQTLSLISQSNGLSAREVACKLGIAFDAAEQRLKRYKQSGYLDRAKVGKKNPVYYYRIASKGKSILGHKPFWSRLKFWKKGSKDGKGWNY